MLTKKTTQNRVRSIALAVSLAVLPVIPSSSFAAGLGRITVFSALGEPLRARLEVSGSREEMTTLNARLASQDAFRAAGVEYTAALTSLKFGARPREEGGRYYVDISTERPLNEPFVDVLVELNWASGRLIREYTFLLDPPEIAAQRSASVPVLPPPTPVEAPPARSEVAGEASKPSPVAQLVPEPKARPGAEASGAARSHEVIRGETLGGIARRNLPEGVTLDQMLVAMFRGNAEAFDGNMNRLRAGRILRIPEGEAVTAVAADEARREVRAQFRDFETYRARLAERAGAAPAKAASADQAVGGKIVPKVEDKLAPTVSDGDKLAVSKTLSGKSEAKGKDRLGALEEDLVARDRALKEANSRIADLEKNLTDLKKLAELKSQAGAAAQKSAEAAKAPPKEEKPAAKVEPPKSEVAKAEPAKAETKLAPATTKPAEQKAAEVKTVTPPAESKPGEAKPAPKPQAKKPAPPPPPPEPTFMEEFGTLVYAAGGLLALLAGGLGFLAYRRKRGGKLPKAGEEPTLTQSSLASASVFGESLAVPGASVGTEPLELSVADTQSRHTGETLDPLMEADTYLAFGKDAQAEEILLEAFKSDPSRLEVQVKLLEVYASRRSVMQFNTLAAELKQQTRGVGPEWARAVELGLALDPNNALYKPAAATVSIAPAPAAVEAPAEATMVFSAPPVMAPAPAAPPPAPEVTAEIPALDFDIGAAKPEVKVEPEVAALDFDLDLGGDAEPKPEAPPEVEAKPLDIDFDLELSAPAVVETIAPEPTVDIVLDVELPAPEISEPTVALAVPVVELPTEPLGIPEATPEPAAVDFDFDIGETPSVAPAAVAAAPEVSVPTAVGEPDENPEAATKLELALAYEEMGDRDGARELLEEVVAQGSPAQQAQARAKLEQLA